MNEEPEPTTEALNTGCSVLVWGALLALFFLLVMTCFYFAI